MEPEKTHPNISQNNNPNPSREENIFASGSGTSTSVKGKGKEIISNETAGETSLQNPGENKFTKEYLEEELTKHYQEKKKERESQEGLSLANKLKKMSQKLGKEGGRTFGIAIGGYVPIFGGMIGGACGESLGTEKTLEAVSEILPVIVKKETIDLRNQLKNNATQHAEQLEGLRNRILGKDNEIQRLAGETSRLKEQGETALAAKENEKKNFKKELTSLENELEIKQNWISQLEQQSAQLRQQIRELEQEKSTITDNYNQAAKRCHEYEQIAAETSRRILDQTLLPDPKDLDIHKWQKRCRELSQTNEAQRGIISQNSIMLEENKQNLESLQNTIQQLQENKKQLETQLSETQLELSRTKNALDTANRRLERETAELNRIEPERNLLQRQVLELGHQKRTLEGELEGKQSELDDAIAALEVLVNQRKELWSERTQNEITIDEKDREIGNKNTEISNLKKEQKEILDEINQGFWFGSSTAKEAVKRLIERNKNLKQYEPSFVHQIGDWTGVNWLTNKIGSTLVVIGFGTVCSVVAPLVMKAYLAWKTAGVSLAVQAAARQKPESQPVPEPPQLSPAKESLPLTTKNFSSISETPPNHAGEKEVSPSLQKEPLTQPANNKNYKRKRRKRSQR